MLEQIQKTEKKKKKKLRQMNYNLSSFYESKKFDDLKELRKFILEFISLEKEAFLRHILDKNGIKIEKDLSKREIYEILRENDVILESKGKNTIIKKGTKKLGEWSDDYSLDFRNGNLNLVLRYS